MNLLTVVIVLGLISTVIALGLGVGSMAHGGEYDEKHATQLMVARVGSQAFTFAVLLLALYLTST